LRYYPGICLEGLRVTKDNFSKNSEGFRADSKQAPPEYKAEALPLNPRCLATFSMTDDNTRCDFFNSDVSVVPDTLIDMFLRFNICYS
jgi:hypothetical protein